MRAARSPSSGIGDDDVGFAAVVAGRQQSRAGRPPLAQRLGHLRQRIAGAQHLAAHQVGGQVAVAEPEPVGLHAVGGEFLFGVPGFVAMAPAALRVDAAAQGVHAGVEVGADPHAVHPGVVADVDDRGQFVLRLDCRRRTGPSRNRCCTPSRKRAPPTPPTRTVTFTPTDTRRVRPAGRGCDAGHGQDTPMSRRAELMSRDGMNSCSSA